LYCGASVFIGDGHIVGEISAVSIAANGKINELRMNAPSPLGLGERTVVLPPGSYIVLRGAVVLDLSMSDVDALPGALRSNTPFRVRHSFLVQSY
jgi:hypothetical protein